MKERGNNRTLIEVHVDTLIVWNEKYGWTEAIEKLNQIMDARKEYSRVITFVGEVWQDSNGEGWDQFSKDIGFNTEVDLAGVQTTYCIDETRKQLKKRGILVSDDDSLTLESRF